VIESQEEWAGTELTKEELLEEIKQKNKEL